MKMAELHQFFKDVFWVVWLSLAIVLYVSIDNPATFGNIDTTNSVKMILALLISIVSGWLTARFYVVPVRERLYNINKKRIKK